MNLPRTQPPHCFYFGCKDRPGHYTFVPDVLPHPDLLCGERENREYDQFLGSLDGRMHDEQSERWLTHWFEAADGSQMTLIAKRDRSVDTRPGSWCGFLMPGNSPLNTALRVAREAFPNLTVWKGSS